jgi:putative ABC transport system ATP-binding protein
MNAHRRSPSLVARDLVRGYGTGAAATPVLRGLSLTLWPGELSLMMGASGSGKSTLLAALSGLLRPESGSVEALGTSLWSLRPRALEQFRFDHCGYIFQGFNLFPALTAIEQVALPLCFGGERESTARRLALDALTEVGLAERLQLRPAQLSGGEKQRVAIARALVGNPQLLFADEPTSALDSANGERVIALLQRIARTHGATVVVVSHDVQLIEHADRVLEMRDGTIVADSRTARAAFDPAVETSTGIAP